MNQPSFNYDIHGLVRLQVVGGRPRGAFQSLAYPLSYFEVPEVSEPDMVVRLGEFDLHDDQAQIIDHRFRVREDYFAVTDSVDGASWKMEVTGLESPPIQVLFRGRGPGLLRLLPEFLAHRIAISPLVELLMQMKGASIVHGAGVAKDSRSMMLFGRGGVHKTSLVMTLLRSGGYEFLGDDRVIVMGRKMLSYPYLFDIFRFRMGHLQDERLRRGSGLSLLRHLRKRGKCCESAWSVAREARIHSVVEIRRADVSGVTLGEIGSRAAARKIVESGKIEMCSGTASGLGTTSPFFYEYLTAYLYGNVESRLTTYWERMEKNIQSAVGHCRLLQATLPLAYTPNLAKELEVLTGGS